jgi:hypothetical protein
VVGDGEAGDVARAESKGRGWDGVLMSFASASALGLASVKGYDVCMMPRRRQHWVMEMMRVAGNERPQ